MTPLHLAVYPGSGVCRKGHVSPFPSHSLPLLFPAHFAHCSIRFLLSVQRVLGWHSKTSGKGEKPLKHMTDSSLGTLCPPLPFLLGSPTSQA